VPTSQDSGGPERSRRELAGLSALGIAYVIAGLGLFYGLAIDSMRVFSVGLVAVFVLLAVSMIVVVRNEPFVSRENVVLSVCIFAAMALYFGLRTFTALPFAVLVGVLVFVGVVLPRLVLQYGSTTVN
jgi:hypothetical protein